MTAVATPARPADPETAGPALRADHLYRFYRAGEEETLALQGVTFEVAAGEVVAVVGPSGSGKSTLLACLAGLDDPSGGTVSVAGTRMSHRPEHERAALRADRVGVLLQSGNLVPHLTVTGNIELAQAAASPGRDLPTIADLVGSVGLQGRAGALPRELSGGEQARAGLAVALANAPAALLADEPTGELDGTTEERVLALLRRTADDGTAVLLVTHSEAAAHLADRVVTLEDGRVAS
ncbi:ATP-binding cassette domain-containing protein [Phycicoccus sp. MAQZ13P-2]|uniref:ABC transporter ATP-binding protein n=1 Tax=Phycicoccus mangrovi TaxID=2840470 RepID=UPI001C0022C4|nr:ATP-binding cassette domain-containing protein [Phycicoccus mangrovi]MBT9257138.1 ATP-binding cassette domain-containing protein [Phycicoccus mangrovi]MBT9276363.1 ATP-binding cassette domain-containing protein [Phycicoccus mangrovi]